MRTPFPSPTLARNLIVKLFASYFTKGDHQGVSIFHRRETSEEGHRGFRLSSLGVLLAKLSRPRPWRHVQPLKSLVRSMYSRFQDEGIYDPGQFDWSSAKSFFEQRRDRRTNSFDSDAWRGWSDELYSVSSGTTSFPFLLDTLYAVNPTSRSSLIRISTTPPPTYPTSSVFLDYRLLRCTNTSSVAGES